MPRMAKPEKRAPRLPPSISFQPVAVRARHDGWTPAKQRAFVEHLADTGCVTDAAALVGMSTQSAYALRRRDPCSVFAHAWDCAVQLGDKKLHDLAIERVTKGTVTPIFYRGEQVGERVVHDNRLLTFLLAQKERFTRVARPADEIIQLWPYMLAMIDDVGAPPLDPDALAAFAGGYSDEMPTAEGEAGQ